MLTVLSAGPMVSVQDAGRFGLLHYGVSASGPMDAEYLALANALVGNGPDAAGLEFAGRAGSFVSDEDILVAVMAHGCPVRFGDRWVPSGESALLRAGEVLTLGAATAEVWGYIALAGGIETPPVLGSRSTHLRSGLGGHEGRALRPGDRLPLGSARDKVPLALPHWPTRPAGPIRVVPGPQGSYFDSAAWAQLSDRVHKVSVSSDRMGMQLDGPPIVAAGGHDIISDVTTIGAIQVPGSGRPVVLLAERQPTGGYPKIATVASVDLPRLAQSPPGAGLRFQTTSVAAAESLLIARRHEVMALASGLVSPVPLAERLIRDNLISGIWGGV